MKSCTKHEKITMKMTVIAFLFLVLSCYLDESNVAGILQGLATGILSGIVLLFITGIKTKDYRDITQKFDVIHKSREPLMDIEESYGTIYHKTYHYKKEKMDFKTYLGLINKTFEEYQTAYRKIQEINFELIPDDVIRRNLEEYSKLMGEKIFQIRKKINNVQFDDKETLTEIREDFFLIQEKAFELNIKSRKLENRLYKERENINNSLI